MPGDPAKLGKRVVEVVEGTGMAEGKGLEKHLRLFLGEDSVGLMRRKLKSMGENVDASEEIAKNVWFDGTESKGLLDL